MSDLMDDMTIDKDKGQQVKSNEITGDRFQFHSLPKEFQDWHNNYYILEKQGAIDINSVSKAILNGYMWKTVTDGTSYGIATAIAAISAVIKWKLTGGLGGFLFSAMFFYPFLLFVAYHFIFYAIIRAQVIGPVTKNSANVSAYTFYTTFSGVFLSLIIAFVFFISIAKDIALLIFMLLKQIHFSGDNYSGYKESIENFFIWLHNFIVEVFISTGPISESIYFYTFIIATTSILLIFLFERRTFLDKNKEIESEVEKTKLEQGYPIEAAQKIMTEWREENGI